MFVLPVSQTPVWLRTPDGRDELLLAEGAADSIPLRVEAARRLASPCGTGVDWSSLPFADVDAALLAVRRELLGDKLDAEVRCTACGAWGDIALSVSAYLDANRPVKPGGAVQESGGWWIWRGIRFRIPTTSDVLEEVEKNGQGEQTAIALRQRCLAGTAEEAPARMNAMLDRMAPPLSGLLRGSCPQCGAAIKGWLDAGAFVLSELGRRAHDLFEHVHLLASVYGWSEEAILALPSRRRAGYANRIAADRLS